jgi:hypothetical protein
MANYDRCYENPAATGCPGDYNPKEPFVAPQSYKRPSHEHLLHEQTAAFSFGESR